MIRLPECGLAARGQERGDGAARKAQPREAPRELAAGQFARLQRVEESDAARCEIL